KPQPLQRPQPCPNLFTRLGDPYLLGLKRRAIAAQVDEPRQQVSRDSIEQRLALPKRSFHADSLPISISMWISDPVWVFWGLAGKTRWLEGVFNVKAVSLLSWI